MRRNPPTIYLPIAKFSATYTIPFKIEVKSAAYIQRWPQRDFSKIGFSIAPARFWNPQTNEYAPTAGRSSDIYVFCLLKHKDSETLNPLKLDQWSFYVLSTDLLNDLFPTQQSLGLKALEKIAVETGFDGLREKVLEVLKGPYNNIRPEKL